MVYVSQVLKSVRQVNRKDSSSLWFMCLGWRHNSMVYVSHDVNNSCFDAYDKQIIRYLTAELQILRVKKLLRFIEISPYPLTRNVLLFSVMVEFFVAVSSHFEFLYNFRPINSKVWTNILPSRFMSVLCRLEDGEWFGKFVFDSLKVR